MSLHVAAKHLASKGRDGDTELVHMTKGEIKGLQGLALAHGGSLSINPNTGLVEAGFLRNMLPMIAGAALVATGVGAPLAAGLVGGFETLRTGDITKGLTAGLSAYGGAGLGQGLTAAGASAANITPGVVDGAGTIGLPRGVSSAVQGINPAATSLAQGTTAAAPSTFMGNLSQAGQGISNIVADPMTAGKTAYAAMPTGTLPALGATVASSMMPEAPKIPGEEEEDPRYKGSPYRYNLASNFAGSTPATPNPYYNPTGLGYGAQGGSTDDIMMAAGGSYDDEPMGDDFAMGGSIGGYSDGGRMLKGPGDGMSDSIPATIGKRQPARLADGEFVVPADVVSHLGNGSTDAGAKHLYSMMDKVRKARTGTKKQGKQIKSEKYMPA
jgi:hypothetical protein